MLRSHFLILLLTVLGLNSCSVNGDVDSVIWDNGKDFTSKNGLLLKGNDLFTGQIVKKYENQSVQSKSNYVDGKMDGSYKSWYSNGNLFESRTYVAGFKTGIHEGWWPNSNKKFIYNFNDIGQYEGELLEWTEIGQQFKIMNYVKGKEAGHQRIWDADGNIKSNYTAIDGDRFGIVNMKNCYSVENEKNKVKM